MHEQNIANLVFFLGKHRNVCDLYSSACERVKELKCVCHTPDACDLESLYICFERLWLDLGPSLLGLDLA